MARAGERRDIDPVTQQPFRSLAQYEARALELLEEPVRSYWQWYCDGRECYDRGRAAYAGVLLRTRCLSAPGAPDTAMAAFAAPLAAPLGVAPSAFHKLGHPDGEVATARGVAAAGGIYCYNYCYATAPFDDVVAAWRDAGGGGAMWLHLYVHNGRAPLAAALRRAEAAGVFSAVVVTCDHPHSRVHAATKPAFVAKGRSIDTPNSDDDFDVSAADWGDLRWICAATALPVVAKGVLCVEDAERAVDAGCRGVFVSGHGGRQCAHGPSALEQLPLIVHAVGARVGGNVFVDTGVRCGGQVLKALALGARAAFVGRPALYGLLCGGSDGVANTLRILRDELRADMACVGASRLASLHAGVIERVDGPLAATAGPLMAELLQHQASGGLRGGRAPPLPPLSPWVGIGDGRAAASPPRQPVAAAAAAAAGAGCAHFAAGAAAGVAAALLLLRGRAA